MLNLMLYGVVTAPDKKKGRGMKLSESDVKVFAKEKSIPIYQPEKVKGNTEFINIIKKINPDLICVVAYGKILPKEILDIPTKACINLHASLLPKYRGAAPIQWAVLNGDKETGVTTMYMDEKMDEGDIILQSKVTIGEYETTGELWEKLSHIGADLLVETIKQIEKGIAPRKKQSTDYSIAPMLSKDMAKIDFGKSITEIKNKIYGLNPIMGAYVIYEGKMIKIWQARILDNNESSDILQKNITEEIEPGTIVEADSKIGLYIKAKNGVLKVLEIQGEKAKKMPINDFLRGNKLETGIILK